MISIHRYYFQPMPSSQILLDDHLLLDDHMDQPQLSALIPDEPPCYGIAIHEKQIWEEARIEPPTSS